MAGLFPEESLKMNTGLLDPGAGIGSLSAAFLEKWHDVNQGSNEISVDAFELDKRLTPYLESSYNMFNINSNIEANIILEDFVYYASSVLEADLFAENHKTYSHVIMNPPYKKIRSNSLYRKALSRAGIETVNLYTAFMALALGLLSESGYMVAIVPRSFCNGPYYKPFRNQLISCSVIRHIHIFNSRKKAFKDDDVLQENIVIMLQKSNIKETVKISTSSDDRFSDLDVRQFNYEDIISSEDEEKFIHIPIDKNLNSNRLKKYHHSLQDIGVQVSTGPVVDFRMKKHLQSMPDATAIPLLYPGHFKEKVVWPNPDLKKANAIALNDETRKWLFPTGNYCVVRRFSSKEEKRRVVASIVQPENFPDYKYLGFENHLNVFHWNKRGLDLNLVKGLMLFLNSTYFDQAFRSFNGHTQVNATDLRNMKYPSLDQLQKLGKKVPGSLVTTQELVDKYVEETCNAETD